MLTREEIIRQFWQSLDQGDFCGAGQYLDPRCTVLWANTQELFRTRDSFIAANAYYPGRWRIDLEKIVTNADSILTVVKVSEGESGETHRAVSFFEFIGDKIIRITEYWGEVSEPPAWRIEGGWAERIRE